MEELAILQKSLDLLKQWSESTVGVDTRVVKSYIEIADALYPTLRSKIYRLQCELERSISNEYRDPRHEMGQ
jgi:hypothetical protein